MTLQVEQNVLTSYGPRPRFDENRLKNIYEYGDQVEVETYFSWNYLPVAGTTTALLPNYIPANSIIDSASFEVITAFTGASTPSLIIGTSDSAGAEIDYNGLFTATLLAALTPAGKRGIGTGALIGTVVTANNYLYAAISGGTYTAGQLRLVIKYRPVSTVPQM